MPDDKQQLQDGRLKKTVQRIVLAAVVVTAAYWAAVIWLIERWDERGLFGDMFGGLNALFSGLALVGVIIAILLQRKELQLQREELALTRVELEKSAKAQEESASLLKAQLELTRESSDLDNARHEANIQPRFVIGSGSSTVTPEARFLWSGKIRNEGHDVTEVGLDSEKPLTGQFNERQAQHLASGDEIELQLEIPEGSLPGRFNLTYTYRLGGRGRQTFVVPGIGQPPAVEGLPERVSS